MASKPEPAPALADKIRAAREAAGLTQIQAGEKSGVHHISIARFEAGTHTPSVGSLLKLARVYGIDPSELLPVRKWKRKK